MTSSANANNTSIYVLDPRGLEMNTRVSDVLLSLAEQTGGRVLKDRRLSRLLK